MFSAAEIHEVVVAPDKRAEIAFLARATLVVGADPAVDGNLSKDCGNAANTRVLNSSELSREIAKVGPSPIPSE
jgi:hypothetical protein